MKVYSNLLFTKYTKKVLLIFVIFTIMFTICACKSKVNDSTEGIDLIEESYKETDTNIEEVDVPQAELIDSILYTFIDNDNPGIYVTAAIKNTGQVPVEITDVSFDIVAVKTLYL